jgi:hypothetical protein
MTFPETLHLKNDVNEHSFMSVTHMAYSNTQFGRYGYLNSGYGAEVILDGTDRWVNFSDLRPKKDQSWRGLSTDLAASLLSFSTTMSHDSGNHSNGYGRPKTALLRS